MTILCYKAAAHLLFADLTDVGDVGEEVVVFGLGHGLAELCRVLEHADQDLQTVEVRVLGRDHLKNGLLETERTFCSRKCFILVTVGLLPAPVALLGCPTGF